MLTPRGYRPRIADARVETALSLYGAVSIEGTKYCGKTWTALSHSCSAYALDDPDGNYRNLRMARADLSFALEGGRPRLIDEWQSHPPIWDGVRRSVDSAGEKGMYILCGSSAPDGRVMPSHSGFGRIGTVRMRTMSLFESGASDGSVSLSGMFAGGRVRSPVRETSLDGIVGQVLRGGWPGNLGLSDDSAAAAVRGYPDDICMRDLPRVDRSKDPARMGRLLRSLARNEGTTVSAARIARDMAENEDETIKDTTVQDYVSVLDRMFLIENQPAFDPNLRSSVRVGKTPKRHLTDPALAAAALGAGRKALMDDLRTFGFLFESMCERDLQVYASASGGRLFHYRDGKGREIDAVVEMPDGRWGAFEVKLGPEQIDRAAEGLLSLDGMIRDDPGGRPPEFLCVISGTEPAAYTREDGVHVVPIWTMRD